MSKWRSLFFRPTFFNWKDILIEKRTRFVVSMSSFDVVMDKTAAFRWIGEIAGTIKNWIKERMEALLYIPCALLSWLQKEVIVDEVKEAQQRPSSLFNNDGDRFNDARTFMKIVAHRFARRSIPNSFEITPALLPGSFLSSRKCMIISLSVLSPIEVIEKSISIDRGLNCIGIGMNIWGSSLENK